jgi:hypothetical protein
MREGFRVDRMDNLALDPRRRTFPSAIEYILRGRGRPHLGPDIRFHCIEPIHDIPFDVERPRGFVLDCAIQMLGTVCDLLYECGLKRNQIAGDARSFEDCIHSHIVGINEPTNDGFGHSSRTHQCHASLERFKVTIVQVSAHCSS